MHVCMYVFVYVCIHKLSVEENVKMFLYKAIWRPVAHLATWARVEKNTHCIACGFLSPARKTRFLGLPNKRLLVIGFNVEGQRILPVPANAAVPANKAMPIF